MTNWLDEVSIADLTGEQLEIAEVIGIENYRKLVQHFGGNQIRIHQEDTLVKEKRDKTIRSQYNGYNVLQLAMKYGLSDRTIRGIVASTKKTEGQISLFENI